MFICTKCDAQSIKWSGRCLECDSWGTLLQQEQTARRSSVAVAKAVCDTSVPLLDASLQNELDRMSSGEEEIDRVLGGGLVRGSLILLSGEPGIGKSTLIAQVCGKTSPPLHTCPPKPKGQRWKGRSGGVVYVSGEESSAQLKARFVRLNVPIESIRYLEIKPVENLCATMEKESPDLVIIDSVQTLTSTSLDASAGSPSMVRYATSLLMELAKRTGVTVILIGQVTKDGNVAGPKTLEHMVDVVLQLEGDQDHSYRLLVCQKNRFGSTDEIGVFEMSQTGLVSVANPSQRFLSERVPVPGSVIAATVEGSRVFLVEVQALVEKSPYGTPVRRASGFDQNRLQMLTAILSKRAGLKLAEQDVYLNVIGGMRLKEPAADLAVCAAVIGASLNTISDQPKVYFGEVGLGGEIRSVPFTERRINEAKRLGIEQSVMPGTIKTVRDLIG
jgi:DNA repair protein RadA/Sms